MVNNSPIWPTRGYAYMVFCEINPTKIIFLIRVNDTVEDLNTRPLKEAVAITIDKNINYGCG